MCKGSTGGSIFMMAVVAGILAAGTARAEPSEADRLQQCDRDLCGIVQTKSADGQPLKCDIGKNWTKEEIAKAISKAKISWSYGDAKCSLKIELERAVLMPGLAPGKNTVKVPSQAVNCEVANEGKPQPVVVKLAPKVVFKDGKASSVSLNVESIEAPAVIKTAVWTAAKMESTFGFFQKDFLKGINDYVAVYCPKTYPGK